MGISPASLMFMAPRARPFCSFLCISLGHRRDVTPLIDTLYIAPLDMRMLGYHCLSVTSLMLLLLQPMSHQLWLLRCPGLRLVKSGFLQVSPEVAVGEAQGDLAPLLCLTLSRPEWERAHAVKPHCACEHLDIKP